MAKSRPKTLKAVKKKIKFLAKWERKLRDVWDIEHDKTKRGKLEKQALEISKRLDKILEFADKVFKG